MAGRRWKIARSRLKDGKSTRTMALYSPLQYTLFTQLIRGAKIELFFTEQSHILERLSVLSQNLVHSPLVS